MTADSIILALDCATSGCAVCVWQDGAVLARDAKEMARGQAEVLIPMVQGVVKKANIEMADVSVIAVTHGPGAFTGLRIGLAAARGLALSLAVPCVGITTLEVLAHAVPLNERQNHMVLACVESKRADIYVQLFSTDLNPISAPLAADKDTLMGLIPSGSHAVLVGDAAARAFAMLTDTTDATTDTINATIDSAATINLSTAPPLPDVAIIARLAQNRVPVSGALPPEPLYLRPPDAKLPKSLGRGVV